MIDREHDLPITWQAETLNVSRGSVYYLPRPERTIAAVPPQGGRKHPQQQFLQVDTTNILFVCGGAFTGLEKIISPRGRSTFIGFGAKVAAPEDRKAGEIFRKVEREDLLKYGLIPEFVGRLPVLAILEDLDEPTLKRILVEPKNALVNQYHRLFEMESIDFSFAEEALGATARKAIERKPGARGLRSIMEGILLDTMFDLPSLEGVEGVVITRQAWRVPRWCALRAFRWHPLTARAYQFFTTTGSAQSPCVRAHPAIHCNASLS